MSRLPEAFLIALRAQVTTETLRVLWVSAAEQRLRLFVGRARTADYPVSTAANGVGCRRNSLQTPVGLHRIAEKIGDGQPVGMIFSKRKPTRVWKSGAQNPEQPRIDPQESDLILTRILRLDGLQPGVNQGGDVDSLTRYIYIHGTNHEALIGHAASHGCIRMRNEDVMTLFDSVDVGALVWLD